MSHFFVLAASCCAVFISCLTISSAAISCGSDINLSAGIGTSLTSDNHPSNYPSGICKKWRITAPLGKRVKLEFISFDLYGYPTCSKSSDDTLKIYDSTTTTNLLGSYCGRYIPADVVSSGRNLYLVFYSNNKMTSAYKGFKLEYSAVLKPATDSSTCSPYNTNYINNNIQLRATSYKQYIQSPLYPKKYPSNIECIWYIKASSSNKKIKLTVTTMRIYNYNSLSCGSASDYDFLKITDGSRTYDKTLREMCSRTYSDATVTSSGQYMTVRFKTNVDNYFSAATSGFKAEFDEIDHNSDSASGVIVGAIFACLIVIGLVLCCICIVKRQRTSGQVMRQAPAVTTATTTTTTTQYPMQPQAPLPPQGTYPQAGASYPPPAAGGYPPAPPGSSYPPQGGYPPPGSNIPPPQASYPPPGSSYPPPGSSYPPPTQGSYPPPSDPPPQYPGPPAYPPQPPFNPSQPNPPYPPAPQGGGASQQYPPPVDTKASAPPPF